MDDLRGFYLDCFTPLFDRIGELVVTIRDIYGHITFHKCSRKKIRRRKV